MAANVELYELLKDSVGREAAQMIAEVVPPARELATKADVADLASRLAQTEQRLDARLDGVGRELSAFRLLVDERFRRVDERFQHMDERFQHMDERFQRMDERFDRMDERFDRMDERFGLLESSLTSRFDAKLDANRDGIMAAVYALHAKQTRALLGFFVPVWAGMFGMILTLLLRMP